MDSVAFRNGAMGDVVPHGSKVMKFSSLDSFLAEKNKKNKKECNTRNSREVTNHSTTLAQARLVLMGSGALVLV
ncbi:hypothetical protein YC2023_033411 [Brassica napus]